MRPQLISRTVAAAAFTLTAVLLPAAAPATDRLPAPAVKPLTATDDGAAGDGQSTTTVVLAGTGWK